MVNNSNYNGTQQEISNILVERYQTNEYSGKISCNKLGHQRIVCSRLFQPHLPIKTTSQGIDNNFNLEQSSKLNPCCKHELKMCNLNNLDNICNINDKKTFSKNYNICCKGKNLSKSGYKEICKKINKKN